MAFALGGIYLIFLVLLIVHGCREGRTEQKGSPGKQCRHTNIPVTPLIDIRTLFELSALCQHHLPKILPCVPGTRGPQTGGEHVE